MEGQVLETKSARYQTLPDFAMCAAPDRACLVRLYEVAPEAVERLYDARTRREFEAARVLLKKADRTCGIRSPSPLTDHERRMGTHLATTAAHA